MGRLLCATPLELPSVTLLPVVGEKGTKTARVGPRRRWRWSSFGGSYSATGWAVSAWGVLCVLGWSLAGSSHHVTFEPIGPNAVTRQDVPAGADGTSPGRLSRPVRGML